MLLRHNEPAIISVLQVRIMTTISNFLSPAKVGSRLSGLLFTRPVFKRQAGYANAPRHKSVLGAFAEWRRRRHAATELNSLSDRELADIGVSRQEIPDVLRRGRS